MQLILFFYSNDGYTAHGAILLLGRYISKGLVTLPLVEKPRFLEFFFFTTGPNRWDIFGIIQDQWRPSLAFSPGGKLSLHRYHRGLSVPCRARWPIPFSWRCCAIAASGPRKPSTPLAPANATPA